MRVTVSSWGLPPYLSTVQSKQKFSDGVQKQSANRQLDRIQFSGSLPIQRKQKAEEAHAEVHRRVSPLQFRPKTLSELKALLPAFLKQALFQIGNRKAFTGKDLLKLLSSHHDLSLDQLGQIYDTDDLNGIIPQYYGQKVEDLFKQLPPGCNVGQLHEALQDALRLGVIFELYDAASAATYYGLTQDVYDLLGPIKPKAKVTEATPAAPKDPLQTAMQQVLDLGAAILPKASDPDFLAEQFANLFWSNLATKSQLNFPEAIQKKLEQACFSTPTPLGAIFDLKETLKDEGFGAGSDIQNALNALFQAACEKGLIKHAEAEEMGFSAD